MSKNFILFIIIFLAGTCYSQANTSDEVAMKSNLRNPLFNESKSWIEYKKLYDALSAASSSGEVNKISSSFDKIKLDLEVQLPEYHDVLRDFLLLSTAKINGRQRGLHSQLGRRTRPDYLRDLRISIERLQIQTRLVNFFLREKIQDKWIDSRIFSSGLKQSVAESLGYIQNINKLLHDNKLQLTNQDKDDLSQAEADIVKANEIIMLYENANVNRK